MNISEQETAYAKINLALHVRKRQPDGYHAIETVFAFVDDGDCISAADAQEWSLAISGPFADGLERDDANNLVLRAARAVAEEFAPNRVAALTLEKRLPVASGIGGGSADAAATIRLLNRFWGLNHPLPAFERLAASLGADVPACLHSRSAIGTGRGDVLQYGEVEGLAGKTVLLANVGMPVSTSDIFSRWDGTDLGSLPHGGLESLFEKGRQDLETPAIALVPEIGELLDAMREASPLARMSGSGATCFALFDDPEEAAASRRLLNERFPKLWTMTGNIKNDACTAPQDAQDGPTE